MENISECSVLILVISLVLFCIVVLVHFSVAKCYIFYACDVYVYEGDVEEDRQDPVAVCRLSTVRGTVLDAFSERQATHWTRRTVGAVRHCTGRRHDATRLR